MACDDVMFFEDNFPLVKSCPDLEDILRKDEVPGVELKLRNNEKLTVHEIVMAARIPHMRHLMTQHREDRNCIFQWKTIPKIFSVAEALVTYVYSGQLAICESTATGLYLLGKSLQLRNLECWSMSFLLSHINSESLDARLQAACLTANPVLKEACIDFMKVAYEEIITFPVFQELPTEILLRLLKDDDLNVSSEEVLFNSLMWWVKPASVVDASRLAQLPDLMAEIRWLETSLDFRNELATREIINTDLPSMHFIHRACMWIDHPDNQNCPFKAIPRKTYIVLYGLPDKEGGRWVCQSYDPKNGQGFPVGRCEARFHAAVVCAMGGHLLVIGGSLLEDSSENATCEVDELDLRTGDWSILRPMMSRRTHGHTATAVRVHGQQGEEGEVIVVCGGRDEKGNILSSCELYCPSENCWYRLPDMRKKRSWTAAAALPDGRLFLFGGVGGDNSVEFCCLTGWRKTRSSKTDAFWREAAPMDWCCAERYGLAATVFQQNILVAGGAPKNEKAVQVFHPPAVGKDALGQWTQLNAQKLNKERVVFSLLVYQGRIFALGSCFTDPAAQNSVEEFVSAEKSGTGAAKSGFESWKWVLRSSPANIRQIWNATVR